MAKYKPRFIRDLEIGIRYDVYMSIDALCRKWKIGRTTYYNWIKKYPEFAEAHELGERDFSAAYHAAVMDVATGKAKGNAGLLALGASHILGWSTKSETTVTKDEEIRTININVLPSKEDARVIEHTPNRVLELVKDE
jgi:transposase-like protein